MATDGGEVAVRVALFVRTGVRVREQREHAVAGVVEEPPEGRFGAREARRRGDRDRAPGPREHRVVEQASDGQGGQPGRAVLHGLRDSERVEDELGLDQHRVDLLGPRRPAGLVVEQLEHPAVRLRPAQVKYSIDATAHRHLGAADLHGRGRELAFAEDQLDGDGLLVAARRGEAREHLLSVADAKPLHELARLRLCERRLGHLPRSDVLGLPRLLRAELLQEELRIREEVRARGCVLLEPIDEASTPRPDQLALPLRPAEAAEQGEPVVAVEEPQVGPLGPSALLHRSDPPLHGRDPLFRKQLQPPPDPPRERRPPQLRRRRLTQPKPRLALRERPRRRPAELPDERRPPRLQLRLRHEPEEPRRRLLQDPMHHGPLLARVELLLRLVARREADPLLIHGLRRTLRARAGRS